MKKSACKMVFSLVVSVLFLLQTTVCAMSVEPTLSISAHSAIVMEAQTGRILYQKNANKVRSMASTTKIMTALLAIASERLDEVIEITEEMILVEGSSIYLRAGERLTLRSLVAGLLLESGNDAANAIAITLAGSTQAFAEEMNEYAKSLGMENTHFVTPSGLDDPAHYTTAFDMALLACAAMKDPEFAEIVAQSKMTVEFEEPKKKRTFYNHNRLLLEMEGCNGIKTGFTKKSGRCLVSSCERNTITLIAVTLNAPDDWNDHKKMMEYGFSQVENISFFESGLQISVPVVGATEGCRVILKESGTTQTVIPAGRALDIQMKIEVPPFLYAPIASRQIAGRLVYTLDGEEIAEISLLTSEAIPYLNKEKNWFEKIIDFFCRLFGIE